MKNYLTPFLKWLGIYFVIGFAISFIESYSFMQVMMVLDKLMLLAAIILALIDIHKSEGKVRFGSALGAGVIAVLAFYLLGKIIGLLRGGVDMIDSFYFWNPANLLIQVAFVLAVLLQLGVWYAYEKAGHEGWKSIVPIYNLVIMCDIGGKPRWYVAVILLVPLVGLIFQIMLLNGVSKNFGKDGGFTVGLVLLGAIFWGILGYGDAAYLPNESNGDLDSFGSPEKDINTEGEEASGSTE